MSSRCAGMIVARVVCALPMVVAHLLRRLLDLVERVAVHGVEQHVLEQREVDAWRIGIDIVAVSFNQCIDNPEFVTWLQATVKK
jgi:hypothetical protein